MCVLFRALGYSSVIGRAAMMTERKTCSTKFILPLYTRTCIYIYTIIIERMLLLLDHILRQSKIPRWLFCSTELVCKCLCLQRKRLLSTFLKVHLYLEQQFGLFGSTNSTCQPLLWWNLWTTTYSVFVRCFEVGDGEGISSDLQKVFFIQIWEFQCPLSWTLEDEFGGLI